MDLDLPLAAWTGRWPAPDVLARRIPTPDDEPAPRELVAHVRYYHPERGNELWVTEFDPTLELTVVGEYGHDRLRSRGVPWDELNEQLESEGWLFDATADPSPLRLDHAPGAHPVVGRRARAGVPAVLVHAVDLGTTADNLTRLDVEVQALDAPRPASGQRALFELTRTGLRRLLSVAGPAGAAAETALATGGDRRLERGLQVPAALAADCLRAGRRSYADLRAAGRFTGPTGVAR